MKKISLSLLIAITLLPILTLAQGGMWIPILAEQQIVDMQQKGFKLSADDIYSVNQACMKDAILIFGGGCTGEIVSDKGLIFTNHHCGRSNIQQHSTVSHDYLTHGYWAKNLTEELPCQGLTVKILAFMEQVEYDGDDFISRNEKDALILAYKKKYGDTYEYSIESFFGGNAYYIFAYKVYTDIRLVAAPPSAIGNFGGDTDNWMWPRHSGDFSVFRIYANKDNNPAEYSVDNIPYVPKYHFKISLKGVNENDFTMVYGFPGTTEKYLPSEAVKFYINELYPININVRKQKMQILSSAMNADKSTRINYSSEFASVENYKKKLEGSVAGLKKYNAIEKKLEFEKEFQSKINSNRLKSRYGTVINDYNNAYSDNAKAALKAQNYFVETVYSTHLYKIAENAHVFTTLSEKNSEMAKFNLEALEHKSQSLFSNKDSALERSLFELCYKIYSDSCKDFMPDTFATIYQKRNLNSAHDFVNELYNTSIVVDSTRFNNTIRQFKDAFAMPEGKKRTKLLNTLNDNVNSDLGIIFYYHFIGCYFYKIYPEIDKFIDLANNYDKIYQKGLLELMPESIKYPDANSTLRFTYGCVKGFEPRDGVTYKHFTTLEGVIEKDNPEIYDYNVPERLKWIFNEKNYGRYADKDGKIHVCFAASNHTTGGNSGSPVINANGELIGINFDRCWEGTMSDIMYDADICRNISVDIRYVLFLIEKLGKAHNIIQELDIVE